MQSGAFISNSTNGILSHIFLIFYSELFLKYFRLKFLLNLLLSFCTLKKPNNQGYVLVSITGESNVEVIQENIQKAVNGKYALFCLGFGFDVSYKFLEKMALSNGGIARRIYENADAALQLQVRTEEYARKAIHQLHLMSSPSSKPTDFLR